MMLLSQFEGRFPTEESCVAYFRDIRIIQGVSCPNCGVKTDKWIQGRKRSRVQNAVAAFPCQGDGNVIQKVVHSHLVLCHALYDIHQAGDVSLIF